MYFYQIKCCFYTQYGCIEKNILQQLISSQTPDRFSKLLCSMAVAYYWQRKSENSEKTSDLPQVTDKLYHIVLYRVNLAWVGFELTMLVVLSTDCTGSYKPNYHMNMTTTAPSLFGRILEIYMDFFFFQLSVMPRQTGMITPLVL